MDPDYNDLCTTCMHARTCMNRRMTSRPIWYCEQFELPPSPKAETVLNEVPAAPVDNPGGLQGLCANCALRETCTFPKPAGGVWHCEEYR